MSRIGILGGTFDPIHLGHIGLAEAAIREVDLNKVILMPAFVQPFKQDRFVSSPEDRLNMLEAAISESKYSLEISTLEFDRQEVSYTFDTICELKKENPRDEIYFIMGSDSMMNLESWYKGKDLLKATDFIVSLRPTNDREKVEEKALELKEKYGSHILLLNELMVPISSTDIREKIERGEPVSGLVPIGVENYIYEQGLYT